MAELDDIVQRMIDAGESEDNIAAVIKEYDNVAVKKKTIQSKRNLQAFLLLQMGY